MRDDYNNILLNAGVIDTASKQGQALRGMKLQASGKRFHIVHFSGPIQPEWHKALEATGVKVVTYIPNNAYLVYGDVASLTNLQRHVSATPAIQWNGDYLDDYKLNPSIQTVATDTYAIQLIKDDEANPDTLALIRGLQSKDGVIQEALGYVNVTAALTRQDLLQIAGRPDVLSIQPRLPVHKFDERQDMIISPGSSPAMCPPGPGYLAWLASKGFTQAAVRPPPASSWTSATAASTTAPRRPTTSASTPPATSPTPAACSTTAWRARPTPAAPSRAATATAT